ncbi:MAG: box helicase, partial [Massilia sp.]|nr:box helicase [Massilia sp.]
TLKRVDEAGFEPDHRVPITDTRGEIVKKTKKPKKPKTAGSAAVVQEDVRFRR